MYSSVLFTVGILAGMFALFETYPYVVSILGLNVRLQRIREKDRTIPSLAGWTILSVEGFVVSLSYYERGDYNNFWFFAGLTIESIIVALLAIWYGEHRIHGGPPFKLLDYVCLISAGASLLVWYQLDSWDIPIAVNIVVDACGMFLIIEKVWRLPRSESLQAWTMTTIACVLSVIALGLPETWSFERAAFPIYMVIVNGLTLVLILSRLRTAF